MCRNKAEVSRKVRVGWSGGLVLFLVSPSFCGVLFLVSPAFSGPFVGNSPKIQTHTYHTWPVVDVTLIAKMKTMTPSIVIGPPSP